MKVLEENVGLLAIQNVMVADNSTGLHTELRLGEDKEGLAFILVLVHRRTKFEGLLH